MISKLTIVNKLVFHTSHSNITHSVITTASTTEKKMENLKIEGKVEMSPIVPPFDTKVTEYLCPGWVFSSDKFRLFNYPLLTELCFYIIRKMLSELKFEKIFHL